MTTIESAFLDSAEELIYLTDGTALRGLCKTKSFVIYAWKTVSSHSKSTIKQIQFGAETESDLIILRDNRELAGKIQVRENKIIFVPEYEEVELVFFLNQIKSLHFDCEENAVTVRKEAG